MCLTSTFKHYSSNHEKPEGSSDFLEESSRDAAHSTSHTLLRCQPIQDVQETFWFFYSLSP